MNARKNALAVAVASAFSLVAMNASAAVDVTEAVTELEGMLVPIGLLGGAALLVAITIKIWKRIRGAA
ncbi:hypothetical protein J2X06_002941 [Lysobacter niastensis]|uniref:Methyltransferase n=1 Tax=Lysobacter niastensis TaxID=380629 RepID=A0ABU1WDR1_9GAMM|nr:major capsid protein [Lysobacter niastensis]MDR7135723.1 hypothetical protein [Lysobacter niastensis]